MSEAGVEATGGQEPPCSSSQGEEKERADGKGGKAGHKKYKKHQHKKWKTSKFKRRKEKKRQHGIGKSDQNQNVDNQQTNNNQNRKHGHCHKSHNNALRIKRPQGFSSTLSKFFLPDKLPRKARVIPPTKFLFGGNISDPLNLNSLQNESENACTPKSSPVPTPPKVEVLIPPNIRDPLHLMDPVDTVEYEMQLCSPMKRKPRSHRHRKRRKSCKENVDDTEEVPTNPKGSTEGADVSIESASTSAVESSLSEVPKVEETEHLVKNLRLELGDPITGRKRRCSESSGQKPKSKRLDMDKIVSPVILQHGGWKWGHGNHNNHKTGARTTRNRTRSHSHSISEDAVKDEAADKKVEADVKPQPSTSKETAEPCSSTATNIKKKSEQYQYGNYDRYYGYRHLNEHMDVRLKVFHKNPKLFKDKDILDIGCNVGLLTIAVGQLLRPKSIVGIDIDKKLIHRARKNLSMYVRIPPDQQT